MEKLLSGDLSTQEIMRNPIAFYGRRREQEPLSRLTMNGGSSWIITTSYAESIALLKDPRLVRDRHNAFAQNAPQPSVGGPLALFSQNMLFADPPDHQRLRGLVSKAFTPRMIEQLRPRIQEITDELIDSIEQAGRAELVADFAFPLPLTVIAEMLGVPATERKPFRAWTQALLESLIVPEKEKGEAAAEAFLAAIKALLASKRAQPGDDLTSKLLEAEEQGDKLSENELVTMIWLLIVGGHETTVNLLSNGVLELLQHPKQLRLFQQQPELLGSAIEELLRYTTPVLFSGMMWAREDIPFHSQVIRKGEQVRISLSAANADPQHFADPETLDITRAINQHLAFGKGIHTCLGAPLARLEGQIAIGTLLRRLPDLRLACEPEQLAWNPLPYMHGLSALPILCNAGY